MHRIHAGRRPSVRVSPDDAFFVRSLAPLVWLDSTFVAPGAVAQWNDVSGNGLHAVQATGIKRPTASQTALDGRPGITFAGAHALQIPAVTLPAQCTVFVVSKTSGALRMLVEHSADATANQGMFFLATNSSAWAVNRSGSVHYGPANDSVAWARDERCVATFLYDASGLGTVRRNALFVANATQSGSTRPNTSISAPLNIGARNQSSLFLTGTISEIIIFNRPLTAPQCLAVERYLGRKWNLAMPVFPADIPDLRARWTPALIGGNAASQIAQINDSGPNSFHLTQGTAANRPVLQPVANGVWGAQFDGVNDFMLNTGTVWPADAAHVFFVGCMTSPGRLFGEFSGAGGNLRWHIYAFNSTQIQRWDNGPIATIGSSLRLIEYHASGVAETMRIDNGSSFSAGARPGSLDRQMVLAAMNTSPTFPTGLKVLDFAIFERVLATDERNAVLEWVRNAFMPALP